MPAEVAKAFLSTAIQHRALSRVEAFRLMADLKQRGQHHGSADEVISGFFSDLNLAATDPDEAKVHTAAQRFEELALFDKFTTEIENTSVD